MNKPLHKKVMSQFDFQPLNYLVPHEAVDCPNVDCNVLQFHNFVLANIQQFLLRVRSCPFEINNYTKNLTLIKPTSTLLVIRMTTSLLASKSHATFAVLTLDV